MFTNHRPGMELAHALSLAYIFLFLFWADASKAKMSR
jgi:hypothetical protein